MALKYGKYEYDKYGPCPIPKPKINGGLYSGQEASGEHRNIPIEYDLATQMLKGMNLGNCNKNGLQHFPTSNRPGNNTDKHPFERVNEWGNHTCVPYITFPFDASPFDPMLKSFDIFEVDKKI